MIESFHFDAWVFVWIGVVLILFFFYSAHSMAVGLVRVFYRILTWPFRKIARHWNIKFKYPV